MQVKRFVAADMRRALELVRAELGPEAIILSNRRTKRGVEIVTTLEQPVSGTTPLSGRNYAEGFTDSDRPLASDDAWRGQVGVDAALGDFSAAAGAPAADDNVQRSSVADNGIGPASGKTRVQLAQEIDRARERMLNARQEEPAAAPTVAADQPAAAADPAEQRELAVLRSEITGMRQLLEEQLGQLARDRSARQSPVHTSLWQRFTRLGLPAQQIDILLRDVESGTDLTGAWRRALACLAQRLPVAGADVTAAGGVFAVVGPTGAGKTTTIGKLAARYVLEHGPGQVALVTTDTFRIAAHDQLRAFGRILNVPVRIVTDSADLAPVLQSLQHCALVLIDTAGLRLGDPVLKQHLAVLQRQTQVKKLVVLPCNSQLQMMKATLHAYKPAGLSGCVLTKMDETASLGEVLGVVMSQRLPVTYTTNGQNIPQDIEVGKAHTLVTRAVALLKTDIAGGSGATEPAVRDKAATPCFG
ncbi:flagellar biosynthesis protein FlhF [Exilibacterium tricleocarpae]|uniref:Flagellar biosynthesis protein FlhF n=2 Tax=Exilibacterium tricleocarpae TaxID=2591008 RepID=A0A545U4D0_9GAMM|nr:flagellar biosynthesis protein FlhF [Exilibacterium tricleocarpae]